MTSAQTTALELEQYDIYIGVDLSGSMGTEDIDMGGKKVSRLAACRESAEQLARVADKFDTDGISVGFFNHKSKLYHNVTPDKMKSIFDENSPSGSTDTAGVIDSFWAYHKANSSKNFLFMILTDGVPDSHEAVENSIISIANHIDDRNKVRLQFIQVGNDAAAATWLEKLDSGLTGKAKYDIVNYQTLDWLNNEGAEKALQQTVLDA